MSNVVKGIPKTSVEYNNNLKTYNVVFEDKIWVGSTSTVYSDVTISTESAIMPNSVVDKDVKTGTIVGGNPAKVISRFPKKFTKDSGELRALFERDKDLSIHNAKSGYDLYVSYSSMWGFCRQVFLIEV